MRKAILAIFAVVLLASFATDKNEKTILKDIEGTLLQSYVVVDNANNTVTFEIDANTTVSSFLVDDEIKILLIENGTSGKSISHTLSFDKIDRLSFDHYFEANYDVASQEDYAKLTGYTLKTKRRPRMM